jgi:beta-aspartyl-peptidase (threonine type)
MLRFLLLASILAAAVTAGAQAPSPAASTPPMRPYGLVLHGGAGVIQREQMTPEREAEYRAKLAEALAAGYAVLERGGPALDAVIATVNVLEDSPLFNAGKGAVFNADGICELDASIMDGATRRAGAIAGVRHIRNPINLARDVMEKSPHVLLIGEGAEKFAWSLGYERVENAYFQTEFRRRQLERAKQREQNPERHSASAPTDLSTPGVSDEAWFTREQKYGTVGCVALDRQGNLAAGTSTGGMTNKKFGRVGDVPVIGAGTYAHNATCAISATGWGEFFIRATVAHDIAAQMEYASRDLNSAAAATLAKVAELGGDGGVIGLDRDGNVMMDFNSAGMYRAYRLSHRPDPVVAIYGHEPRR